MVQLKSLARYQKFSTFNLSQLYQIWYENSIFPLKWTNELTCILPTNKLVNPPKSEYRLPNSIYSAGRYQNITFVRLIACPRIMPTRGGTIANFLPYLKWIERYRVVQIKVYDRACSLNLINWFFMLYSFLSLYIQTILFCKHVFKINRKKSYNDLNFVKAVSLIIWPKRIIMSIER